MSGDVRTAVSHKQTLSIPQPVALAPGGFERVAVRYGELGEEEQDYHCRRAVERGRSWVSSSSTAASIRFLSSKSRPAHSHQCRRQNDKHVQSRLRQQFDTDAPALELLIPGNVSAHGTRIGSCERGGKGAPNDGL